MIARFLILPIVIFHYLFQLYLCFCREDSIIIGIYIKLVVYSLSKHLLNIGSLVGMMLLNIQHIFLIYKYQPSLIVIQMEHFFGNFTSEYNHSRNLLSLILMVTLLHSNVCIKNILDFLL